MSFRLAATAACLLVGASLLLLPARVATADEPGYIMQANYLLEANLARDAVLRPLSFAPDFWLIRDTTMTGIVHSSYAASGFWGGYGSGLCFRSRRQCPGRYNNLGFRHLQSLGEQLGVEGGFHFADFSPLTLSFKMGLRVSQSLGPITLRVHALFTAGLSNRDNNNEEIVHLPITIDYRSLLFLQSGLETPLADIGSGYRVPLSVVLAVEQSRKLSYLIALSLPALAAGSELRDGFDNRAITIGIRMNQHISTGDKDRGWQQF